LRITLARCTVVQDMLVRHGYVMLATSNGAEALQTARKHNGRIDLLITDVVMPGMSGRDLAEQFRREWPDASELYMSGYTDDSVMHQDIIEHSVAFIQKPFTPTGLLQQVREVLNSGTP
jgi:two-component system cell cycle sensor histidine kinase/response regulator CckA